MVFFVALMCLVFSGLVCNACCKMQQALQLKSLCDSVMPATLLALQRVGRVGGRAPPAAQDNHADRHCHDCKQ